MAAVMESCWSCWTFTLTRLSPRCRCCLRLSHFRCFRHAHLEFCVWRQQEQTRDANCQCGEQGGVAREFVNRVQKLRKTAGLVASNPVSIFFQVAAGASLIPPLLGSALCRLQLRLYTWSGGPHAHPACHASCRKQR